MPERASVFQTVQVGVEATAGVAPAGGSNRLLQSMQIVPAIDLTVDTFRPMGNKFMTVAAPARDLAAAQIMGKLTYTEIVYPFSSLWGAATITGTGPFVWTFNPASAAADNFQTFQVQGGNAVRAQQWNFGLYTGLTISGSRDGWDIRGTMLGQAVSDGITMTAAPTPVALVPVLGKDVSIFYDTTSANIGTTKLGRVLRFEMNFSDKYAGLWAVDQAQASFVAVVERAPTATVKFLVEADAGDMTPLVDARAGNYAYMRFRGTQGTNVLTIDMAIKHVKPDPYQDEQGVYAMAFNGQLAHDPNWSTGRALTAVVTNGVAAL